MAYQLPSYGDLQRQTSELALNFHHFANSYIFPKQEILLSYTRSEIKACYLKKIEEKKTLFFTPSADPNRLNQIAFISQLRNDLDFDLNSNESDVIKKAEHVLFGAVVHCYLSLKASYEKEGVAGYLCSFVTSINNCALNKALLELFNLETLDDYSTYLYCSAFWEYLNQPNTHNHYEYINKDKDFFVDFKKILHKTNLQAAAIREQLNYIAYIQSIFSSLTQSDDEIANIAFNALEENLASLFKQLGYPNCLTRNDLLDFLEELNLSERTRKIFADLLPPNFIIDQAGNAYTLGIETDFENKGPFIGAIGSLLAAQSKYILLGAYLLCLSNCIAIPLNKAIKNAIRETVDNAVDTQTYNNAIGQLEKFINRKDTATINCSAWESLDKMKRALLVLKDKYANEPISSDLSDVQFTFI